MLADMTEQMVIAPVILEGRHVRLEPLTTEHTARLAEIGLDADLWAWIPTPVRTPEEMSAYVQTALKEQAAGSALPFALIEKSSGRTVGSTRYGNIDRDHHRVEIGWTWVARQWQRTAINTEAKYLLLRHAFETLRCIRVELKTDSLNERSRGAILRIGARQEGIFRKHMITASGRIRHTVYFSIVDSEWPEVKARLEAKLR
jgi:RimJ/RimL family protein N-acetyltransferase